jgi:glyoxylase-like metal-dependent hydrolase (beta-lactamase superfamily II)
MAAKRIVDGVYGIGVGGVNVFLLEDPDGFVLIDAGFPEKAEAILEAVRGLGKQPRDVRHIVVTHGHPDHIGSLAALQRATGAETWMHPLDAGIARAGGGFRKLTPAPGLLSQLMLKLVRPGAKVEPAVIDHEIEDGEELPIAGGLRVVHMPGHCAGQVALLWPRHGGVLFAADACMHLLRLDWTIGYEDIAEGGRSLRKLNGLAFDVACFGHGRAIVGGAAERFREKWPAER